MPKFLAMREELEKISISLGTAWKGALSGVRSRLVAASKAGKYVPERKLKLFQSMSTDPGMSKVLEETKRPSKQLRAETIKRFTILRKAFPKTSAIGRGAILGGIAGAGHGIYTSRGKSGKDKAKDVATRAAGGAVMGGAAGAAIKALGRGGLIAYRRAIGEGEEAARKAIGQAREATGQVVRGAVVRGRRAYRQEASRITKKLQVGLKHELTEAHKRLLESTPELGRRFRSGAFSFRK